MKFLGIGEKINSLMSQFSVDIGVDLGTSNTLIYVKDRGVVVDEPTMLVRQKKKKWTGLAAPKSKSTAAIAFGYKAKEMLNREPVQLEVISPLKNGIISDLEATEELISYYLKLIYEIPSSGPKLFKPKVIVGVPSSITEVEKRAVKAVFITAGAREVILVEEAILAAIGAGMPVDSLNGLMVVDVGGGKTEVTVLSMGGVVLGKGLKWGGNDFDTAIINYIKMKYGLLIGVNTAERIKVEVANLTVKNTEERKNMVIRGRDLESGLPKSIKVDEAEIMEAVMMGAQKIVKLVGEVLDQTPPELMEDIIKRGIIMVGKGVLLKGLEKIMETETKIAVNVAAEPGMCVIQGCGILLEDPKQLNKIKLVNS